MAHKGHLYSIVALISSAFSCRVVSLAIPISIQNLAGFSLSIVGAVYIGRLGPLPLSASVLANSLYNCSGLSIAMGLSAGMETLCGQVGSGRSGECLQWQLGVGVGILGSGSSGRQGVWEMGGLGSGKSGTKREVWETGNLKRGKV